MQILKEKEDETINWFRNQWGIEVYENLDVKPLVQATQIVWDDFVKEYDWAEDLQTNILAVE